MINGAHIIIYTKNADADRAFFKDVLGLPYIDDGDGWLIFGFPPSEVALHPSGGEGDGGMHQVYLMCEDVEKFVASMVTRGIECSPVADRGWGLVTKITLPGGGKLGVYQPRHARPKNP